MTTLGCSENETRDGVRRDAASPLKASPTLREARKCGDAGADASAKRLCACCATAGRGAITRFASGAVGGGNSSAGASSSAAAQACRESSRKVVQVSRHSHVGYRKRHALLTFSNARSPAATGRPLQARSSIHTRLRRRKESPRRRTFSMRCPDAAVLRLVTSPTRTLLAGPERMGLALPPADSIESEGSVRVSQASDAAPPPPLSLLPATLAEALPRGVVGAGGAGGALGIASRAVPCLAVICGGFRETCGRSPPPADPPPVLPPRDPSPETI